MRGLNSKKINDLFEVAGISAVSQHLEILMKKGYKSTVIALVNNSFQ